MKRFAVKPVKAITVVFKSDALTTIKIENDTEFNEDWDIDPQKIVGRSAGPTSLYITAAKIDIITDRIGKDVAEISIEGEWAWSYKEPPLFLPKTPPQVWINEQDHVHALEVAIERCRVQFKYYADHHKEKGDTEKMLRNLDMVKVCEDALGLVPV